MGAVARLRPSGGAQILDEAAHLLRRGALYLLPAYYIGSLPFVLGLLYFWADMSRSGNAWHHIGLSSLAIAALFVWMKYWQSIFALRTRDFILGENTDFYRPRRILTMIALQTAMHAGAFIILPVAFVLILPFTWCYAFFQNVTAVPVQRYTGLLALQQHAWRQAVLWPRQNFGMMAVMTLFAVFVALNLAGVVFLLPYLAQKFFNLETIFTLSGAHALNTTFWAAVVALTYLCLDPIMKTAYTLRCFYGESIETGSDIQTELMQCDTLTPST